MPTYLHPGVYVEEIPSGSKPIEGVGTSTAAFVGNATKGPIGEPELLLKWDDYVKQYGGIRDSDTEESVDDLMGFSVSAFFQNGGGKAYVVRITKDWNKTGIDPDRASKAKGAMDHPAEDNTTDALLFTAVNEGSWANGIVVKIESKPVPTGDEPLYTVKIGRNNNEEPPEFFAEETFTNISVKDGDSNFITKVINGVSELVTVEVKKIGDDDVKNAPLLSFGTSFSGDLSELSLPLDLSGSSDEERTLSIALDGTDSIDQKIEAKSYKNLAEIAQAIQNAVTSGQGSIPIRQRKFTCVAQGNKLVLTSGTNKDSSAVSVQNSGLAADLKLGLDNGGTETTGSSIDIYDDIVVPGKTILAEGKNGAKPGIADYEAVFTKFLKIRDINTICLPGQNWPANISDKVEGQPVIDAAIAHAVKMKSRMVIVDPPPGVELDTELDVNKLKLPNKTYSVLYYPWAKVANPFYNAEKNPGADKTVLVPPCGFAAGMWAKIDGKRGVWKAPAGLESGLGGIAGLEWKVEDGEQDALNPLGVNCLRSMPGPVIWGARTLATKADPEWRYVPVRRTAIMIEQSIFNGIQWAVFEPNDHRLWSALKANIGNFMNGLFRVGAFQGEKASDAYFVRCGLGDTMTQGEIDAGQVIVVVGFAPLKPAEFVIVRIQQKVDQQ